MTDVNGCTKVDSVALLSPVPIQTSSTVLTSPNCSGLWTMGFQDCCRNGAITNLQNPLFLGIHGSATINAALDPPTCNSSVQYFNDYTGTLNGGCQRISSMTFGCPNVDDCYVFQQSDPDGDVVVYSLVAPLTGPNTSATFVPPFSATNPFPGTINFNGQTGQLCYNVTQPGFYQFTVMAEEFDPVTNLFKGRTYRDLQLVIMQNCIPNSAPFAWNDSIYNFTSTAGANQTDSNEITMCEGGDFCFKVTFMDSNMVDTNLCMTSNVRDVLVGPNPTDTATIVISAVDTLINGLDSVLRITADVCWTAPPGSDGNYNIIFSCSDDHCPSPTVGDMTMSVNVVPSTVASPDVTICGAQTTQLNATGGNSFVWTSIQGDPIIVGQNFSCDSCTSPIASPSQTTHYEVTSDLVGSCKFKDTVIVTVAPDFQLSITPDTVSCTLDTFPLQVTPSLQGNYTYNWSPANDLTSTTISNPSAHPTQTTTFFVTATSADNCVKNTSTTITILPLFPPVSITASDSVLCDNDSAQLTISFGGQTPTACGLSPTPCYGTSSTGSVGTGNQSNTAATWPAPFGNQRNSAKHQMLVLASELTGAGFSAGMITGIAFDVTSVNGANTYTSYTVGIGCTGVNSLPFTYLATSQVVSPTTVTLSNGWNWIPFSTPYLWDGTSNIVVETCFDNPGGATQNTATRLTNFPGSIRTTYFQAFNQNACNSAGPNQGSFNRPNINFEFCSTVDPTGFNYSWNPNFSITDTAVHDPQVYPPHTTIYSAIVYDTFGVCSDTVDIEIMVAELDAGNDTLVCKGDSVQFQPTLPQPCAQGGEVYSWAPFTGLNNPNIANPKAAVNQTTTYTLTYTNACGCVLTDSVTIEVSLPEIDSVTLLPPTCGLSDGALTIHPNGGYPLYQFSIDSGGTYQNDSLFTGLAQGVFNLIYQDSVGCISPVLVDTLIKFNPPKIDSIQGVHLSCFDANDGSLLIYGSGGTQPLMFSIDSGATYQSDSLFENLNGGIYSIFVRDADSCISFMEIDTLFPVAELNIDSIQTQDILCQGAATGEISIFASGGTMPYEYSIDSGQTYVTSSQFVNLTAGYHYIMVKDSKDCVVDVQLIELVEPQSLSMSLSIENDTCYNACGGSASVQVLGGVAPYSYTWLTNTFPQNQLGIDSNGVDQLCAGSYILMVTDSNNCLFDTTFTISTPDPLIIDSTVFENVMCNGEENGSVTVHLSGGTLPYAVSIDGISFTQTYLSSISFGNLGAGTYPIVVSDSNFSCTTTSTVTLVEPNPVEVEVPVAFMDLCVGACANLSASANGGNGGPYLFTWSDANMDNSSTQQFCPNYDPSIDTTIVVFAEDNKGCRSDFASVIIHLYDSLEVTLPAGLGICPEDSIWMEAIAIGGDGNGYNFLWTPSSTLSHPTSSSTMAFPTTKTMYTVRVTDNCGTPAVERTVEVDIHPLPTIDFDAEGPLSGCEPFDITLTNKSTPTQYSFWSVNNDPNEIAGLSATLQSLPAGVYDIGIRVVTPQGCEGTLYRPAYINVNPKPKANFEFSPQPTTVLDPEITFGDLSSANVTAWEWDFAGLATSIDKDPKYEFPSSDTGIYPVTLIVESDSGCTNDTTHLVRIGANFNFFVPNSFTPNGDGLNDVFAPMGIGVVPSEYSLLVYDRWGNLVYSSKSVGRPWDGTINNTGEPAQIGSYVWKIVANDYTDEHQKNEYSGYVNLIR